MTSPGFLPGAVPPHTNDTGAQLRKLEKQIDTLGRKDLTRANIGQGGRLRGLYGNGNESVLFGVDPDDGANKSQIKYSDGVTAFSVAPGAPQYGSKEQMYMRDIAGRPVYATDEVAGYGLSHPTFTYGLWGREELQPGANLGAATIMAEGIAYVYNPAWHVMVRVRLGHTIAGTSSINMVLELSDQTGAVLYTSQVQTEPATGVVFAIRTFERMVLVPQTHIGRRLNARVKAYAGTPSDWNVTMYPFMSTGLSKAGYDLLPALQ
jgi:hypothetical protein